METISVKNATEIESQKPTLNSFMLNEWLVEPDRIKLSNATVEKTIRPKEMELLILLVESKGEVVTSEVILNTVWNGVSVNNDSLYFALSQLRKTLGDNPHSPKFIETIPKRGYRLVCKVKEISPKNTDEESQKEDSIIDALTHHKSVPLERSKTEHKYRVSLKAVASSLLLVASLIVYGFKYYSPQSVDPVTGLSPSPKETKTITNVKNSNNSLPMNAIAVLPFDNLSKSEEYNYISNGISTELMQQLSQIQGLKVAARSSTFAMKKQARDVKSIGQALQVGAVVEGNIQVSNETIKLNAQLIDTNNGYELWSHSYQIPTGELFDTQEKIGAALIAKLLPELSAKEAAVKWTQSKSRGSEAHLHYLKGVEGLRINSFQAISNAVIELEQAVALEPNFVDAILSLAEAKLALLETGVTNDQSTKNQAEQLIKQATQLAPTNGLAYALEGKLAYYYGDKERCVELFKLALKHSPHEPRIKAQMAASLVDSNPLESERLFSQAIEIDPFNDIIRAKQAIAFQQLGRLEEAKQAFIRATELNPQSPNHLWKLANHQMEQEGKIQQGIINLQAAIELDQQDPELLLFIQLGKLSLGDTTMPESMIHRSSLKISPSENNNPIHFSNAFSSYIESLYFLLSGQKTLAMQKAKSIFKKENVRFSHGSRQLLIRLVVDQLLLEGKIDEAESFLLENEPSLVPQNIDNRDRYKATIHEKKTLTSLAYANILKLRNQQEKLEELLTTQFNYHSVNPKSVWRSKHHLVAAEIAMTKDNHDEALNHIELAVAKGFRFNWQMRLIHNSSFAALFSHPRFTKQIEKIKQDMNQQRSLLAIK